MGQLRDFILAMDDGKQPEMLQIKYGFMAENAFRFYRGTCGLFYRDLTKARSFPDSPLAWLSGDLHLENFGAFKGNNRLVYFDLNDFDEAILAPLAWEITRLVTSIFVAFDSLEIEPEKAQRVAKIYVDRYAATLAKGKAIYIEPKTAEGIVCDFLKKAARKKLKELLKKRTSTEHHRLVVEIDDPRHDELDSFTKRELMHHLTDWIIHSHDGPYNYEVIDVAYRIAGTGSVGQPRYMFLLESLLKKNEYMLVDMKQAFPSSLKNFVTTPQPDWESEAHRIVSVQERMQNVPPALLSATIFKDESYILQELQPVKDSINFKLIKDRYRDMCVVIESMAVLTASAQLRSSGRQGSDIADALIAFGENEDWKKPVLDYAAAYAAKVKKDHRQFLQDWKQGYFKKMGLKTSGNTA